MTLVGEPSACRVLPTALLVLLSACGAPEPGRLSGSTMGTFYNITWLREDGQPSTRQVHAEVEGVLEDVNASMSTYREDSEITAFNRAPVGQWVAVSAPFMEVLLAAREVGAASGGAYDVSVGPLVDLWGFGPSLGSMPLAENVPSAGAIAAARARVGLGAIQVDADRPALLKVAPRALDFSSIAKGHGVDKVAARLEQMGIGDYLVDIGGEIRVAGVNHRGEPWRVAIERPGPPRSDVLVDGDAPMGDETLMGDQTSAGDNALVSGEAPMGSGPLAVLALGDRAVATSGDYRNYFEVDGRRYSHSIDPRSGWPVAHGLVSVTVVHESATLADAWATALIVLGPVDAPRVAAENNLAAYLVTAADGGWHITATPQLAPWLDE